MRKSGGFMMAVRRLARDRRGNFGMMMAVTAPMLALAAGYGLNVAQMATARSHLLNALDSAVTSTARDLTTGAIKEADARETVKAFLYVNGERAFIDPDLISLDKLVVDKTAKTVSAQASVMVDMAFPLFGADDKQKITTRSAAVYSDKTIEIAMMLDVTGSMEKTWKDDKLGDLQKAATNVVDLLLAGQNTRNPRIRMALVPYSNSVNVGAAIAEQAVFVETKSTRGQVHANTDPKAVSRKRPDNCATERKGDHQYTDAGPDVAMVNRDYLLGLYAEAYHTPACRSAPIVPLTADAEKLTDTIDDFVAVGGTAGHIGIQWTWYMLSEKWKDVVGSTAAAAKKNKKKVAKIAILMTDGEFNLSYFDADRVGEVYNPYGKRETRNAATKLCEEMRRDGIEIFTVGFKLDEDKAREVMADCASPDTGSVRHYFDTADGDELNAAFTEIARNIERLALTE